MLAAQAAWPRGRDRRGSVARPRGLHPIQRAFVVTGAIQSGYSTPAMILAAKALLDRTTDPTEDEIRDALSGILDRETGYVRPVEAVLAGRCRAARRAPLPGRAGPRCAAHAADGPTTAPMTAIRPTCRGLRPGSFPAPTFPETKVVGKPEPKVDALKLAKGKPAFVDDIEIRGMLYAKMLYSPHAHARIVAIDDSKATGAARRARRAPSRERGPGAVRIRWPELPEPAAVRPGQLRQQSAHVGDRVAAVAADTEEIAAAGGAADRRHVRGAARRLRRERSDLRKRTRHPRRRRDGGGPRRGAQHRAPHRSRGRRRRGRFRDGRPRLRADLQGASGAAVSDRAAHRHCVARQRRADGDPHLDPGAVPRAPHGRPAARYAGTGRFASSSRASAAGSASSRRC